MGLRYLQIENFRIIKKALLAPSGKFNIIYGENAAGKTSLLETIDILSRGRSFRTNKNSYLINKDSLSYKLFSKISSDNGKIYLIGVEWSKGEKRLRLEGKSVHKQSIISKLLPVRSLDPHGDSIVTGTSKQKRSHIDWGVFHVKQGFNETLRSYHRVLSQKNLSLRKYGPSITVTAWDTALAELATKLDCERSSYIETLNEYLTGIGKTFESPEELRIEYKRGWKQGADLKTLLNSRATRFHALGYVDIGPQLAEYEILTNGKPAKMYASGGQQKLISAAFIMAQIRLLGEITGKHVTFLLDDLPSELDFSSRKILLKLLDSWEVQVFMTTHDMESIPLQILHDYKLFHVKHGEVREL